MENPINMSFKIVLLGDSYVGKTSILYRFTNDEFNEHTASTVGISFSKKIVERKNMKIVLEIWDTAGQEKFKKIAPIYYRNSQGIIIVFDRNRAESFEGAKSWLQEVEKYLQNDCIRFLVGNKADLQSNVSEELIEEFISANNLNYIETSAKDNQNIQRLFRRMARSLAKIKLKKIEKVEQNQIVKLQLQQQPMKEQEQKKKHSYCCQNQT